MKRWLVLTLLCTVAAPVPRADEPAPAKGEACLMLNNRVLGPRSADRPLPLSLRDPSGFRPACAVPWSALSPRNQPLPVLDCCCQNSMLQVANDSACGRGTGPLWVDSRWVVTSAELQRPEAHAATCQQLDTGAWAGTRAYDFDCVPQKKELQPKDASNPQPAAAAAAPAPAPAATPGKDPTPH
jgi:hypothetical protein